MADPFYTDHLGCKVTADDEGGFVYYVDPPTTPVMPEGVDCDRDGLAVARLQFQNGNPHTLGINGLTNEHLLAILYHRIGVLDAKMPDQENKIAKHYVKSALTALERRTKARQARNVEGTDAP